MTKIHCPKCNNKFDPTSKWGQKKFCSSYCAHSRAKTIKSKIALSIKMQGLGKFTKISFHSCEICSIIFMWNSIHKGSKRCCSDPVCFKQFKYNVRKGKVGGFKPNSCRKTSSFYKGYKMDSKAELMFAQLLDSHNINWIKNSTVWFEYLPGKKYYPDFYLKDFDAWIEIKGKYYIRENDSIRWLSVPNLEVIYSDQIKLPAVCTGFEPV